MTQPADRPRIRFSEWLPDGVMVHFEGHASVFFAATFLYEQREKEGNEIFTEEGEIASEDSPSAPGA